MCFKRHPDGRWGLEPQRWPDGHTDYWRPLDEQDKPWLLRGQDHGTQVVLLGQHERHDTTQAPDSVTDARRHWISRYLNARFLRLPTKIEVLVREQHDRHERGQLQHVHGEQHHLERHRSPQVPCSSATRSRTGGCSTTIIEPAAAKRRSGPRPVTSPPCTATSSTTSCRRPAAGTAAFRTSASASATSASCSTSSPRSTPAASSATPPARSCSSTTSRSPWARWGEEFTAAMPDEIRQLQERAATADGVPRQQAIRQRVSAIMPLYRLSRYRPTQPPRQPATGSGLNGAGDGPADRIQAHGTPPAANSVHAHADEEPGRYGSGSEPAPGHADGPSGSDAAVDLPDVAWISARDGSRAPRDLEDQAARYHPGRHELTINADFRAITDLITHWQDRYKGVPGARAVIEAHVREWCEQILVEVVLAARNSTWRAEQLGALLSPTSLTAALLPRHLLHATLQKRLGQKLGAPRGDAGGSSPNSTTRDLPAGRAPAGSRRRTGRSQEGRRAGSGDPIIGARQGGPEP